MVGPLAPSQRILQRRRPALCEVITFSVAAGMQDVAIQEQGFLPVHVFAAGESGDGAGLFAVLLQRGDIQAVGIVYRAIVFHDGDDVEADGRSSAGRHAAHVAEALDHHARRVPAVRPSRLSALSVTIMQPRPVASGRPRDPPSAMGLPVTTAGERCGAGAWSRCP